MRAKNIMLILILQYVLLLIVSTFLEINMIEKKARDLQVLIRTAGDLALEQTQYIDEFLTSGGDNTIQISMPRRDGNGFQKVDMFVGTLGYNPANEADRTNIFNKLYNTNDFKMLALRLDAMRKPVRYWNVAHTAFGWYTIPVASMMGTDMLPNSIATKGVKDLYGNHTGDAHSQALFQAYRLQNPQKTTGGKTYYNTPLNLGITYINEDILGLMFMNNIDLLMRQKYKGVNLNSQEGGNGVLKGQTFSDSVTDGLALYNPIHNGSFSVLRGEENYVNAETTSYRGITPQISYKVIDMYDDANDSMLRTLFGANRGGYTTKAEYLKSLDSHVLNPATGQPYNTKPIVVAKVTFYLDVVVPYFSVVMRELKSVSDDSENYLEITPESPDGQGGTRRISYTRYFAVTP